MQQRTTAEQSLIIYCDESLKKGAFYGKFYGGALIRETDRMAVEEILRDKKQALNLNSELKWEKISAPYAEKYQEFISAYFDLIRQGYIKVRVMFQQAIYVPTDLTEQHLEDQYFLLYYQFIKGAFGLMHANAFRPQPMHIKLFLDNIPDKSDKYPAFKNYVVSLKNYPPFTANNIMFSHENIADVDSKKHDILQGLDVIMGAMQFRLNDKHLVIPEGKKRCGKRTVAKEKVYKHIHKEICTLKRHYQGQCPRQQPDRSRRWPRYYCWRQ